MKRTILVAALVIACGAGAAQAQAPVADYFSASSTMDGAALALGATIEAYDANGIRCGLATANADGSFLIHVYGNDPMTPAIDEGAQEGEMLHWRLNGIQIPDTDATWMGNIIGAYADVRWENGAAKQIQLDARTSSVETQTWSAMKDRYRN